MRSIAEHLERIEDTTTLYVKIANRRRTEIIEAARDGATVVQLAEVSRLPLAAVSAILGEEYTP